MWNQEFYIQSLENDATIPAERFSNYMFEISEAGSLMTRIVIGRMYVSSAVSWLWWWAQVSHHAPGGLSPFFPTYKKNRDRRPDLILGAHYRAICLFLEVVCWWRVREGALKMLTEFFIPLCSSLGVCLWIIEEAYGPAKRVFLMEKKKTPSVSAHLGSKVLMHALLTGRPALSVESLPIVEGHKGTGSVSRASTDAG